LPSLDLHTSPSSSFGKDSSALYLTKTNKYHSKTPSCNET
ncbi:unnamed protein product, partial [Rotaria magnacalcarata]